MNKLTSVIFTHVCFFCGELSSPVCYRCLYTTKVIRKDVCVVCGKSAFGGFTHATCKRAHLPSRFISILEYEGVTRACIKKAKFGAKIFYPLKYLTQHCLTLFSKCYCENFAADWVVVPIPLNKLRYRQRGFNHAEIIAREVALSFKLRMDASSLQRVKHTPFQFKQKRDQRFSNLVGAFSCSEKISGKKVVLVDDVCTSGATLLSASAALYKAGAKDVVCFTLAKKLDVGDADADSLPTTK